MSLTRIEKYSERGYILKNPPGRLLIVTYWTALGVWLTPGGRRFDLTNLQNIFFPLFFFFLFFFAPRFATLTVDPLIVMYAFCWFRGYFLNIFYFFRSTRKKYTARRKRKAHPAVFCWVIKHQNKNNESSQAKPPTHEITKIIFVNSILRTKII